MSKIWKTRECDHEAVLKLSKELGVPRIIAAILAGRGYGEEAAARNFLDARLSQLSDPFLLPDMDRAVDRIWAALDQGETIVIHGDYDADGVSSTALMVRVLSALGGRVIPFIPNRVDDGYGLSADTLKYCIETHHPGLLITVDCGTSSADAVRAATEAGVDVVITDHHEAGEEIAPAMAVVNPKVGDHDSLRILAGVGVAFKLCHALLRKGRDENRDIAQDMDLRAHMDLVSIGTIADMVPLTGENRVLARYGLGVLDRTESAGLKALKEISGVRGTADTYHVGFLLGPRLNAAGRMGGAEKALELLLTDDAERGRNLAQELDGANRERQELEARIVEAAEKEIDDYFDPKKNFGLVLAREGWHPGVIGIVASRLVSRYRRPAVVIAMDEEGRGKGSCRSIEGFNLVEHLAECADLLEGFGGHAMAAGLEVSMANVDAFRDQFNRVAKAALESMDLRPVQSIDAWIELDEIDEELMSYMDRMKPFGFGNPTPVLAASRVRVMGEPRILKEKHLKMKVSSGNRMFEAIGFGLGGREVPQGPLKMAFQVTRNEYRGRTSLQLQIKDFQADTEDS